VSLSKTKLSKDTSRAKNRKKREEGRGGTQESMGGELHTWKGDTKRKDQLELKRGNGEAWRRKGRGESATKSFRSFPGRRKHYERERNFQKKKAKGNYEHSATHFMNSESAKKKLKTPSD